MQRQITRNQDGLITDVDYQFNDKGQIDWRKMIRPEFLVVNTQRFQQLNKPVPTSIEGLEDRDLLILLAGIKDLARVRGYTSVDYAIVSPSSDYVLAKCSIGWIPNYETENRVVYFSAIGDAGLVNTSGFGRLYLGAIAENRAFVRAVRSFLSINIVGQDELAPKTGSADENIPNPSVANSPTAVLEGLMKEKNITFEIVKEKLLEEKVDGAADFTSINDIPKITIFNLIERIKKVS